MTDVRNIKTNCHICGTEYQGPVIYSWNETLSGEMPKDRLTCPNCDVPYRSKVNPNVGNTKDILTKIIDNKKESAKLLFNFSLNNPDIDEWKKMMLEIDYKEWEKSNDEFIKNSNDLSEDQIKSLEKNDEKRKKLEELQQKGELQKTIEEVVGIAKEEIREEKNKYNSVTR